VEMVNCFLRKAVTGNWQNKLPLTHRAIEEFRDQANAE
jgi:hypothetical protein